MEGIGAYRENSIVTQPQGVVIVKLYEGAIMFLRKAVEAIGTHDATEKGRLIGKAIDIIDELNVALNMESGGEIAQNLRGLYVFMLRHLRQANVRKDAQMVRGVIGLLEELNSGWKAVTTEAM